MAAETEIRTFLCRSDNIGVLIRDPATGPARRSTCRRPDRS